MPQPGLTEDTLFIACTRPAMWQGVPIEAVCINAMATTVFFILMKNPSWKSELLGLKETFAEQPWIVALFPMFFTSNIFYTYQMNDMNGQLPKPLRAPSAYLPQGAET